MKTTTIEDHPWLAVAFGSPHPARALATAVPLLAVLAWAAHGVPTATALALGAGGVFYWTFAEYALHRWFYHWRPRRLSVRRIVESFHVYHHRHPKDRSVWNAGPLLILPLTALLAFPVWAALASVALTAAFMTGAVIGYGLYEWAHYLVHARTFRRGPLRYLQGFHLHHHHGNNRRCYGVTNPLWDLLLGTAAVRAQWRTAPPAAEEPRRG